MAQPGTPLWQQWVPARWDARPLESSWSRNAWPVRGGFVQRKTRCGDVQKKQTQEESAEHLVGCLRWGLHGLPVSLLHCLVDRTTSGVACRVEPGLRFWRLYVNVWRGVLFWEGYGWAELYRLSRMSAITIVGYELFPYSSSSGCLGVLQ